MLYTDDLVKLISKIYECYNDVSITLYKNKFFNAADKKRSNG